MSSGQQAATSVAKRPTVGVFDSGFGGLTVLRALMQHLPAADYLYLGDTARLPYGSKSAATVTRYTDAAVRALSARGAELVVVACNTASALALPVLRDSCAVTLVGVVEPGAEAAAQAARDGRPVLVLATEATIASHAYAHACAAQGLATTEKACPLLVPLVEEGWTDHAVTEEVVGIYLNEAAAQGRPGAVLLGCTHYPLLRPLVERAAVHTFGNIPVVDAADAVALHVRSLLQVSAASDGGEPPTLQCFATDSPEKFQRLGPRFLGRAIDSVVLVDLDS